MDHSTSTLTKILFEKSVVTFLVKDDLKEKYAKILQEQHLKFFKIK